MPKDRALTADEAVAAIDAMRAGDDPPLYLTRSDLAELVKFATQNSMAERIGLDSPKRLRAAVAERFMSETVAEEKARQRKATRRSAEARKKPVRDRQIHDASAAGKPPKVIAAQHGLALSTVSEILSRPRP